MSNEKQINNQTVTVGPSGMVLLTIVLVLLKVYDKIDWSWWWVFSPMWLPITVLLAFMALGLVVSGIILLVAAFIK